MQYTVVIHSVDELKSLTQLLEKNGFVIFGGLAEAYDKRKIVGICIDLRDKVVFGVGSMIMACLCTKRKNPVHYSDIMENFDRLIKEEDYDYYLSIIEKNRKQNKKYH